MLNIIFVAFLTLSGSLNAPTCNDAYDTAKPTVCYDGETRVILLPTMIVESKPSKRRAKRTKTRFVLESSWLVEYDCAGSTDPLCGMP